MNITKGHDWDHRAPSLPPHLWKLLKGHVSETDSDKAATGSKFNVFIDADLDSLLYTFSDV
jgi:hypothetical protein